jgi:hypothetical protein
MKKGRQSRLPRFIHRWWAKINGYFWIRCPICQRYFGGHENNPISLIDQKNKGWMICRDPACTEKAKKRNFKMPESDSEFIVLENITDQYATTISKKLGDLIFEPNERKTVKKNDIKLYSNKFGGLLFVETGFMALAVEMDGIRYEFKYDPAKGFGEKKITDLATGITKFIPNKLPPD